MFRFSLKKIICWGWAAFFGIFLNAGEALLFAQTISHSGGSNYTLVERTNLRQYVNGKYVGLTSREVRSFIFQEDEDGSTVYYSGDFYVEQDTVRKMQTVGSGIHDAIPSSFSIASDGRLTMGTDNGFPSFRSFPVFPLKEIAPGDQWKGESVRAVDPLNNGTITRIPMTVLYTYVGRETYKGQEVYRIKCQWATRYGISYWDWGGDQDLKSATGSHNGYVLVSVENGSMVFMTDTVDESFIYKDGTKVDYKGTILNFTEYPVSYGHEEILDSLKKMGAVIAKSDAKDSEKTEKTLATAKAGDKSEGTSDSGKTVVENKTSGTTKTDENGAAKTDKNGDTKASESKKDSSSSKASENGTTKASDKSKDNESSKGTASSKTGESAKTGESTKDNGAAKDSGNSDAEKERQIQESLAKSESKILVEETDAGVKLSIHDLKFKADSDELMPGESKRLDEIAAVLKKLPSSMFLVEGHTADTGYKEGEQKVSTARARKIAQELAKRGIDEGRFICKGVGATKPIASNSTAEGKAMNRRVEITILE